MSGSSDDERAPRRGAVPPPPSLLPGDAPDPVAVPRMEPPPASLGAMVQSRGRGGGPEESASWLVWIVVLVIAAAVAGYVTR